MVKSGAKNVALGVITIAVGIALACQVDNAKGDRVQQTNPDVQFYALGERYPKGLTDFQAFGMFRKETHGKVELDGWVMTNREDPDDSTVDMRTVRVSGKRLTFTTKSRKGVVFTFDGRYLHTGDFSRYLNKQVPVVEGTVRKLRNGKKVAEGRMRFTCGVGG